MKKEITPTQASILFDIEALGGKEVRIPEKEEYPDLFPKDENGRIPLDEHYKAHLAHVPKNEIEELENQGFIATTMVNGSKIVDLVTKSRYQKL